MDSELKVSRVEKKWEIRQGKNLVAEIYPGYESQVETVLFYGEDPVFQRKIKLLALSHAVQYVKSREPIRRVLLANLPERELKEYTADNLMDFAKIPEQMSVFADEDLDKFLGEFAQVVISSGLKSLNQVFEKLLAEIKEKYGVTITAEIPSNEHDDEWIEVELLIEGDQKFCFWKDADNPHHEYFDLNTALFIVPSYHPILKGYKGVGLVNGSTDYYIKNPKKGVRQIFCPIEARRKEKSWGSSWNESSHPFYAKGSSFVMEVSSILCLSKSGYEELMEVVTAALNKNRTYIAVSGGFNSPYDHPGNILQKKGIPSPAGRHGSYNYRGSENTVVWEYRVLEKEGELAKSFVPSWLKREGWLNIYNEE